ncbi:MAG: class I SAM-dependent methyltransferase [Candidatus Pacearchaeota archaeon]
MIKNYKKKTREVYDKFPEYFDKKFREYILKFIKKELDRISKKFPKGAKILDLGSGPGNHALFLKNKGFDVLCLDISESMLQKCKEKGLNTIKSDIENLNFKEGDFDVIWAYTSLLHIPKSNIKSIIRKIHYIIKEDGFFFLSLKEG